jgi:hypothetical protein
MGLEINLISFIPLISSQENIYTTKASLKYFLVQTLASSSLLFLVIIKTLVNHTMLTRIIHSYAVITPSNKNRSITPALMIPKSDRGTEMK